MAPQQPVDFFDEEEWDNEDMIVPSAAHIFSKENDDKDCELGEMDSTTIMTPPSKPKSILRRRRLADDSSTQQQGEQSSSSPVPSHWPTASAATKHFRRRRVHFADGLQRRLSSSPPSVVTAIYFRERTPLSDISLLYYSTLDIKNFKREFRALLRAQRLTRERMGQNSEERITMTSSSTSSSAASADGGDVKEDTSSSCSDGPSRCNNTTTFESSRQGSSGGFFSSVFDVVFGTSNSSSYYQKDKPTFHHHHLVDTLYIF